MTDLEIMRTYTVNGMTCGHCVASVTEELQEIPGIEAVDVTLDTGELVITSQTEIDPEVVRAAVETAGYRVA